LHVQINTDLPDIIQLLPDNIANQIAAGEVIQRPASAVKELLENAVDAGATEIRLVIQDAGKSLIQVADNGRGMSEGDARMAFERHATSKISKIEDLFEIRTMGFRGEALASIAAVAQVEMKTRRPEDNAGTFVEIENSRIVRQEPVASQAGTVISVKNLFFNVPARRNFLKSNASEMRHILDEFIRIALSFPGIFFSLTSNGQEVYHLEKGTIKQRAVQVLGAGSNGKLVSVQERTDYLDIYGFAGKPETARKTRGDQYFFVNNRFIRSNYLNHAVMSAYKEMIPADSFPLYLLFIDLEPSRIDINVHPTKQEIKFEDEKIVYAFVQAAVKHALAQFSITPTLDFDLDPEIQKLDAVSKPVSEEKKANVMSSSLYQAFTKQHQAHLIEPDRKSELHHWKDTAHSGGFKVHESEPVANKSRWIEEIPIIQVQNSFLIATTDNGFYLIHQQAAHERVLYEHYSKTGQGKTIVAQKSLFPVSLELAASDAAILNELLPDLRDLGYLIEPFGKDSFVIQGIPGDVGHGTEKETIETLLEQFKNFSMDRGYPMREKLIRCLARQRAVRTGTVLTEREMHALASDLFGCDQPNMTPSGTPTCIEFTKEYLEKIFKR
jgi:DNA mismatch repair protein MutL